MDTFTCLNLLPHLKHNTYTFLSFKKYKDIKLLSNHPAFIVSLLKKILFLDEGNKLPPPL